MNGKHQAEGLKTLGEKTGFQYSNPSAGTLETFPNSHPENDYVIEFVTDEFTSLCPRTGQPDWASLRIAYVADEQCVESKSLKLYLGQWRGEGSFMERIANTILGDLVRVTHPRAMLVEMKFNARGGIDTNVSAHYLCPSLTPTHAEILIDLLGI